MSIKLIKLTILFPHNIFIILNLNNLIIKGPFGTFKKNLLSNSFNNFLFSNLNKINIKYFNKISNQFTLSINRQNYFLYKTIYHNLINTLKKYIEISSTGFLSILQIWGIGYKIIKKNNNIYLFLGYSHSIQYKKKLQLYLKPFIGTYLFLTSHLKENVLCSSYIFKKLKKKDIYKGKGIRFLNEVIQLKIGKRD